MNSRATRWRALPLAAALIYAWASSSCAAEAAAGTVNQTAVSAANSATNLPAKAAKDAILLTNGDVLYGKLLSIDPGDSVRWKHPDVSEPIDFLATNVVGIRFGSQSIPAFELRNPCRVRLTNQDELDGNLVACDADKVVLQTWYAGTVTMPRKLVQYIAPKPMLGPPLYEGPEGPNGPDGWTFGKVNAAVENAGVWTYRDGAFYATKPASIARDLHLPDAASIQCDLNWKGILYLAIALYTDSLQPVNLREKESEPNFAGFYSLQVDPYSANLLAINKQDPIRNLGQTPVTAFGQKDKATVDIRVDKSKNLIALMVDGIVVKQWTDPEGFIAKGTGIRIVHQGQGSVKMSDIRVTRWDGQFDERPSNPPDSNLELIKLSNGDRVVGEVKGIQNDGVSVQVSPGAQPLEIAINRIKLLEMAVRKSDKVSDDPRDVRAWFRNGGSLTFRLEGWTEKEVTATSGNFGTIQINPLAFDRVQLILRNPEKTSAAAGPLKSSAMAQR